MGYYLDPGLDVLRDQLTAKYPGITIGWIGDNRHATDNPTSDHNPEADGSVDAIDPMITSAFSTGDCDEVINAIVRSRDPRVKYIIWKRRIISSYAIAGYDAWEWRPYKGTDDPHTGHAHISVNDKYEGTATQNKKWSIETVTVQDDVWNYDIDSSAASLTAKGALKQTSDRTGYLANTHAPSVNNTLASIVAKIDALQADVDVIKGLIQSDRIDFPADENPANVNGNWVVQRVRFAIANP